MVLIEQKVDFSEYVLDSYGTADCIIVSDDTLQTIDFKYGLGVLVDAEQNTQQMCYSIGALNLFDSLYDIEEVTMHIFQPRRENVQNWTIPVDELKAWAENELKPKAQMTLNGEGEYHPGEWCQFCKAAVRCRARAEEKLRLAQQEFKMPPLLTDAEMKRVLPSSAARSLTRPQSSFLCVTVIPSAMMRPIRVTTSSMPTAQLRLRSWTSM